MDQIFERETEIRQKAHAAIAKDIVDILLSEKRDLCTFLEGERSVGIAVHFPDTPFQIDKGQLYSALYDQVSYDAKTTTHTPFFDKKKHEFELTLPTVPGNVLKHTAKLTIWREKVPSDKKVES